MKSIIAAIGVNGSPSGNLLSRLAAVDRRLPVDICGDRPVEAIEGLASIGLTLAKVDGVSDLPNRAAAPARIAVRTTCMQ
jgi:hypothetical protein